MEQPRDKSFEERYSDLLAEISKELGGVDNAKKIFSYTKLSEVLKIDSYDKSKGTDLQNYPPIQKIVFRFLVSLFPQNEDSTEYSEYFNSLERSIENSTDFTPSQNLIQIHQKFLEFVQNFNQNITSLMVISDEGKVVFRTLPYNDLVINIVIKIFYLLGNQVKLIPQVS